MKELENTDKDRERVQAFLRSEANEVAMLVHNGYLDSQAQKYINNLRAVADAIVRKKS